MVEYRDKDRWQREVEDVQRESAKPLRIPSGHLDLWHKCVCQVIDGSYMRAIVAAVVHVRAEKQSGPQLRDDEHSYAEKYEKLEAGQSWEIQRREARSRVLPRLLVRALLVLAVESLTAPARVIGVTPRRIE